MRFLMRVKFVVVLSVILVMLAGSAWAAMPYTEEQINNFLNDYNDTSGGSGSGLVGAVNSTTNTIIITGEKTDVTKPLIMVNIAGWTIEWNATLTANTDTLDRFPIIDGYGSHY